MWAAEASTRLFGGVPEIIFSGIGIVLTGFAFWQVHRSIRLSRGQRALGRITGWRNERNKKGARLYRAIFCYRHEVSGEEIELESRSETRRKAGRVGDIVPVRFDPAEPHRAEIAEIGKQLTRIAATLALGLGAMTLAWYLGRA